MVASAIFMPQMAFTLCQTLSFSYRSLGCSLPSNFFSNRPPGRHVCFAVSCALSSPSLVDQSTKFMEASRRGNLFPLHQCIFSDQLTPVLAYRCLVSENDHETPSFLLESVEPGIHSLNVGRYSIVGANPTIEIVAKKNLVTVMNHRDGLRTKEFVEDPLMVPQRITESWVPGCLDELPQVFCGGWFGYFSYDSVRYSMKRHSYSTSLVDDINIPDLLLGLYDDVLVFDHVEKKIYVIHWIQLDRFTSTEAALDNGVQRLESLVSKVHDIVNPRLCAGVIELNSRSLPRKLEVSSTRREAYREAVQKAKEHMLAGTTSQVVLSQQFERRTFCDPFDVYRALNIVNPSPLMAYFQVRGCVLVASSPEILNCAEQKRTITNRPLAGTIDRGLRTVGEDAWLVNGARHYKEHMMLAQQANGDVHKVTATSLTRWDALCETLPLGTLTGEPKIKALELIDELGGRRGPHGGSFGCISFSGDMDIALSSKTMVFPTRKSNYDTLYTYGNVNKQREWTAFIQGGATVMVDSDPRDMETVCESEAAAFARAIDLAESSFLGKN